jgi:hypothetical protein
MIWRVAVLIGTARPRPIPATAVLMPTTRPRPSASAPTGVAGIERRVGLDDVVDEAHVRPGPGRQRAPKRRHDTCRHRAGEAVRVPDRDDELTDAEPLGVAELGRGERIREPQHREVGQLVCSYHRELDVPPVGERRAAGARGPRDDMRRGDKEAVGRDDDAAATAGKDASAAHASLDAEVRDGRRHALRSRDDDLRVRVECVVVCRGTARDQRQLGHAAKVLPEERFTSEAS